MNWHIHWREPVTEVLPPYALTRNGAWGQRLYRCRCGTGWWREERRPNPPKWREARQ